MAINELLKEQRGALKDEDIPKAVEILDKMEKEIETEDAWEWLRKNDPKSYKRLIEKLKQGQESLTPNSGSRTELGHLTDFFVWRQKHGIELSEFGEISKHLHRYREAVAHLRQLSSNPEPTSAEIKKVKEAITQITKDPSRQATREWTRSLRGKTDTGYQLDLKKANGYQTTSDDDTEIIVIRGPKSTMQQVLLKLKRFVAWDLEVDSDLVNQLNSTKQ
jgi:DNA-directed RNA polymerase subunit F